MVMRIAPRDPPPPPRVEPRPSSPAPASRPERVELNEDSSFGADEATGVAPESAPAFSGKLTVPMEVAGKVEQVEVTALNGELSLNGEKVGKVLSSRPDGTLQLEVQGKAASVKLSGAQAAAAQPRALTPDEQPYPSGRPETYVKTQFPPTAGAVADRKTMIDTLVEVAPKDKQAGLRDLLEHGGDFGKGKVDPGNELASAGVSDESLKKAFDQVLEARKSPGAKPLAFDFVPERRVLGPEYSNSEGGSSSRSDTVETGKPVSFKVNLAVDAQGKVNGAALSIDQVTRLSTELTKLDPDLKRQALKDAGVSDEWLNTATLEQRDQALAKFRQATLTPGKHTVDVGFDETYTVYTGESDSHSETRHIEGKLTLEVDAKGQVGGKPLTIETQLATNKVFEKLSMVEKKAMLEQVGFKPEDLKPLDADRATSFLTRIALEARKPGTHTLEFDNGPDKFAVGIKVSQKGELEGVGVQKLEKPKKKSAFMKILGPVLTIASFVFPPAAPFIAIAQAGLAAASGAKGLALFGSVLGAAAGVSGLAGFSGAATALNQAAQVVNGVNGAIQGVRSGNFLGALGSALSAGAGVSSFAGADQLAGTLNTASRVSNAAGGAVTAARRGDILGALGSGLQAGAGISQLAGDADLAGTLGTAGRVATAAGGVVRGIQTGNVLGAIGSGLQAGAGVSQLAGNTELAQTLGQASQVVNGVNSTIRSVRSGNYSGAINSAVGVARNIGTAQSAATGEDDDGDSVGGDDGADEVVTGRMPVQTFAPAAFGASSSEGVTGAMPVPSLSDEDSRGTSTGDVGFSNPSPTMGSFGDPRADGLTGSMPVPSFPDDDSVGSFGDRRADGLTGSMPAPSFPDVDVPPSDGLTGGFRVPSFPDDDSVGSFGDRIDGGGTGPVPGFGTGRFGDPGSEGVTGAMPAVTFPPYADDDGGTGGVEGPGGREATNQELSDAIDLAERLAGPPTAVAGPGGQITVQPGETLSEVARKYLGNARLYADIYALNREAIGPNPNVIPAGLTLVLPGANERVDDDTRNAIFRAAYIPPAPPGPIIAGGPDDTDQPLGEAQLGVPFTPDAEMVARFGRPSTAEAPSDTMKSLSAAIEIAKSSKDLASVNLPGVRDALGYLEKAAETGDRALLTKLFKNEGFRSAIDVVLKDPMAETVLGRSSTVLNLISPALAFGAGFTADSNVNNFERVANGLAQGGIDILVSKNPVAGFIDTAIGLVDDRFAPSKNLNGAAQSIITLVESLAPGDRETALSRVRELNASGKNGIIIQGYAQLGEAGSEVLFKVLDHFQKPSEPSEPYELPGGVPA